MSLFNDLTIYYLVHLRWLASLCNDATLICNSYVASKKPACKCFININKDVYFRFRFSHLSMFTSSAASFLTTGYTGRYGPVFKDFHTNENAAY